jgi:uncharacterized protein YpuA (DUF1002 family)
MKSRVLFGIAGILVVAGLSVSAAGQAIAESALTHAFSSTVTTQAGSTLGRSLNQATGATQARMSGAMNRVQQNVQRPAMQNQAKVASVPRTAMPGNLGLTIRGGQVTCGNGNSNCGIKTAPPKQDSKAKGPQ